MFKLFRQSVESVVGSALGISNPDESYNESNHKPRPKAKERSASPIEAKKTQRLTRQERDELSKTYYDDAYSDLRKEFDEFVSSKPKHRRYNAKTDYMPPVDRLTMDEILKKEAKNKAAENFNAKVVNPYYENLERSQPEPDPEPDPYATPYSRPKTKQHHNTYSRPQRSPPRSYTSPPPRSPPKSYSRSHHQSIEDLRVLGLDENSSDIASINKAYRKLVMKFHPDKQATKSDAEKKTAEINIRKINEAHENLIGKNAGFHKKTTKKRKQRKTKTTKNKKKK